MITQITHSQIATLTPKERLALIEVLWESMAETEKQWPLSPAQRKLVQQRIEDHRKNPREGQDYRTVLARLRGKSG
jgi:putative addiction module component (TIGR02574 family)